MAEIINKADFEQKVLKSDCPVIVDFFATWCGPCKMLSPIIDSLSQELPPKARVYKVDIDADTDLALEYNVRSVPTMLFFKDGKVADMEIGAVPKELIEDKLQALL